MSTDTHEACSLPNTTVLIVDDEPASLNLLQRTLRGAYRVLRAMGGSEGLDVMERHAVSVVVADQRMPGMTGVEFLTETSQRFPNTQRILITGYTDREGLIDAINAGRVYGYVAKPWHPDVLLSMLRRAVDTHHLICLKDHLLKDLREKNRDLERLLEETRILQEEKVQSERWATLGKMAGMVAHDLRNPLAAIRCQAGLALEEVRLEDGSERSLLCLLRQVERMNQYIDELLLFSKPDSSRAEFRPYEVKALAAALGEAFAERFRQTKIRFEARLHYTGTCRMQPARIYRVLENLLKNALEATGQGGRILLETGEVSGGSVLIRVVDSGPGIPVEAREGLFEPFVSLNKPSGTGLGLAIVKKIVQEHGGQVWIEKGEYGGACFTIRLNQGVHQARAEGDGVEHERTKEAGRVAPGGRLGQAG